MVPERSPPDDPTVAIPTSAPPCTDFITAVPMSVIITISLHRKYLTLVQTTQGETLLRVQKSNPKIGKIRRRPQYRIYSGKGKELMVSCDKKYRWSITWPNQPHREVRLKEHSRYCDAWFSNPFEEGLKVEMAKRENKITNMETGKVLTTVRRKRFWRRKFVLIMGKDVDVVLMAGLMMCTAEMLERRARKSRASAETASSNGGGAFAGGCW